MATIVEKIQKLLNHEQSARSIGNLAEAEAFSAKIASLLFAHKLSMSEVEVAREEIDEPVEQQDIPKPASTWASILAKGCAEASFSRILIHGSDTFRFIGRESNRLTAIALYQYLYNLGNSLADSGAAAWKGTNDYAYRVSFKPAILKTWKRSFLIGYANAIYWRMADEVKKLTAAAGPGSALVYVDKERTAIEAFIADHYPHLGKGRKVTASGLIGSAYALGKQAGTSVSIKGRGALGA